MRVITSTWFETTVRYEHQTEEGKSKKVNEVYVVDALTFGEAEKSIIENMTPLISGEFDVKGIIPAAYSEIFFSDNDSDDRWYKVKSAYMTLDGKSGKEKLSTVAYLVQASSVEAARSKFAEVMSTSMLDYVLKAIVETKIIDVFEHNPQKSTKP